jgi:predicted lipoprotein with Yx(FWY)xxD motif
VKALRRSLATAIIASAITLGAVAAAPAAGPAISLTPNAGPPGTSITVDGVGFCANPCTTVSIQFGGVSVSRGVAVDASGAFHATFRAPGGTVAGSNLVTAVQQTGSSPASTVRAFAYFDITPSGSPTPRPAVVVDAAKRGKLGKILVTGTGFTLYHDALDRTGHLNCSGSCLRKWTPLTLPKGSSTATAGPGVTRLGAIRRPDGRRQVTVHGMPLYLYVGDKHPGSTRGQGVGHFSVVKV